MAVSKSRKELSTQLFFEQLGATAVADMLRGLVWWLHDQAKADGIERLFFLARDGYMIQQAYLRLVPEEQQIPNQYLYASRRVCNVPAITRMDEAALDFLSGDRVTMPVGDYLRRVGLVPSKCAIQIQQAGFVHGSSHLVTPELFPQLKSLLLSLSDQIIASASAERDLLVRYLETGGSWRGRRNGIVDIGWHGSMQLSLARVLGTEPEDITGYYLGLHATGRLRGGGQAKAMLTEYKLLESWLYRDTVRRCMEVFELCLAEPAGSIIRIAEPAPGQFRAVRERHTMPLALVTHIQSMQQAALTELERHPGRLGKRRAMAGLRRLVAWPTPSEADLLGGLLFYEGFAGVGKQAPLALPAHTMAWYRAHPMELLLDWHRSFWPRGFWTRLRHPLPSQDGSIEA